MYMYCKYFVDLERNNLVSGLFNMERLIKRQIRDQSI